MPTITRKIELRLCTEGLSDQERKAQWDLLYHINDNLYRAANNISSKLYLDDHVSSMVRLKHAEYLGLLRALEKARKQKSPDEEVIEDLSRQVDKSQDGSVRMGAPARWRSSYGNGAENLEKVGWGVIPDHF